MRIVFLTREYPPETTWGGCAIVNYNIARALASNGHNVHVICQGINLEYDRQEEGVWVHRVGHDARLSSIQARINYMIASWFKLRSLYKTVEIDIVQADHWSGEGIIGTINKKSALIIKTQTGPGSIIKAKNYKNLKEYIGFYGLSLITNFVSKFTDRFISESQIDFENIVNMKGISQEKIDLIYNGIDTNLFRKINTNIRENIGIPDNVPLIMTVGRLEKRKGIDVLAKTIPLIVKEKPNAIFLFIGRDTETSPEGGSFKQWLMQFAQKNGFETNIIFKGFVPPEELPQYYSACDVFVLSSREESFALVVAEAMACGKPVVSTPVGIVLELVKDNFSGLEVVPIENHIKLAEGVLKILSLDTQEKNYIGNELTKLIEKKFSFNTWINQIENSYIKAINTWQKNIC